jgi:hypothetical protein
MVIQQTNFSQGALMLCVGPADTRPVAMRKISKSGMKSRYLVVDEKPLTKKEEET